YESQLALIGRLIWERSSQAAPLFAVGSSGIEDALAAHWREEGLLNDQFNDRPLLPPLAPASQVLAVSGSCSPVTARQINEAARGGYALISLETPLLIDPERSQEARGAAVEKALGLLRAGRSVILHSCLGPEDARVGATARAFAALGYAPHEVRLKSGKLLGVQLGRTLQVLLEASGVRRVVVAGGDTSGYIASELGITALTMAAPLAPGAPLCRAYAPGSALHGLEMAFKGGQVGKPDFFVTALHGAPTAHLT
ncbi:MAG: four-carbon acid sugar kinase family protein, partial [Deinococcota bacterium]|nr:four-carbon acid sugar kinase family protein [Deinococcota bacterium]